ncbi:MAG TPA: lipid II flippase MurJ, partial [Gammaproteobacteria bacterium]|nr:lipid II flippase MurJ [Gammaproteobacteria bacterium]
MISNMIFNLILIWPLAHAGIALATSLSALLNTVFLYYFLRKKEIYTPRVGWQLFGLRLVFTNTLLAVWLWFGAGDLQVWLMQDWQWRVAHILFLLVSAVAVYFAGLWVSGIRVHHLLIPQRQTI